MSTLAAFLLASSLPCSFALSDVLLESLANFSELPEDLTVSSKELLSVPSTDLRELLVGSPLSLLLLELPEDVIVSSMELLSLPSTVLRELLVRSPLSLLLLLFPEDPRVYSREALSLPPSVLRELLMGSLLLSPSLLPLPSVSSMGFCELLGGSSSSFFSPVSAAGSFVGVAGLSSGAVSPLSPPSSSESTTTRRRRVEPPRQVGSNHRPSLARVLFKGSGFDGPSCCSIERVRYDL